MRVWLVATLVSTAARAGAGEPLVLTTGWPDVLDLEEVQSVTSADPTVVAAQALDASQVLLLGAVPGVTTVTVVTGPAAAPQRQVFKVKVIRQGTAQSLDGALELSVDERRRVRLPGLSRLIVGDADLCDALPAGPDTLELVPRRAGLAVVLAWTGGTSAAHRRVLMLMVQSGGVSRTVDESDAVLTEPLNGRLVLVSGEHALLVAPGATRFAVVDDTVAEARLSPRGELLVEGRSAGATWLWVWTKGPRPVPRFVVVHPRSWCPPSIEQVPEDDGSVPVHDGTAR